jgi:hypothetical protein
MDRDLFILLPANKGRGSGHWSPDDCDVLGAASGKVMPRRRLPLCYLLCWCMLTLKPTDLGAGKLEDDFEVFDENGRSVGRILWLHNAPRETPWFWTITERAPQSKLDRGYAATREDVMAAFKAVWERE